jgi:uncharacterized protein YjbI with pentapeptide repeats
MHDREVTPVDHMQDRAASAVPVRYAGAWPTAVLGSARLAPAATDPSEAGKGTAPGSPGLAERLAAAEPRARAAILIDAVMAGAPIALPGADLRGVDLRPGPAARRQGPFDPDLRPRVVVLDGADLAGVTLSGANLSGVSLRGAALDGALLVGADLTGADLTGATLRSANLTGARLTRADLSYGDLRGASLLTAYAADVIAVGADLRDALLQSANLRRAVLRAADLRWARLTGASLAGADLRDARFEGAILAMANCAEARLSESTDFGLAFLYRARLERSDLRRRNIGPGIGEAHTDLSLAADTYRGLAQVFAGSGRGADARWAHRRAARMATATHRPDRSRRFHAAPWPGSPPALALYHLRHAARWLGGLVADAATGYGTCARRLLVTAALSWLGFALFFTLSGGISHVSGRLATAFDALRFSAAALTPMEAYPLVAVTAAARWAAAVEGMAGLVLLGALGYVVASRLHHA